MKHLEVGPDVVRALDAGRPVVALESTIISHGFPYPSNLECAMECERIAREEGAVPATVAIIGGTARVGLAEEYIEHLATAEGISKVSRRDLAAVIAGGGDGATTVSATMVLAAAAGIRVFATGGIGGAHRGAQSTFDISADLMELARTPVAVVCAGAKSILDLQLTLEVLETHGVPVLGYRTDEFPAFYKRSSGLPVDTRCDTPEQVAAVLRAAEQLGLGGGALVANPIDAEYAIDAATLDPWIESALAEADAQGVRGGAVTPFVLARLHSLSSGATEEANKQLVYSNVRLASRVAAYL
jgi:pseudouridylate synthase